MESTRSNWTCIALAALLAYAPPVSFAQAPAPAADPNDARHCLDLGDIVEVVRCAEPYRHRRAPRREAPAMMAAATPPARPAPAAPPPEATPAAAPAKAAPASPPSPAPKRGKKRARDVDARHCLDLGSNAEIARCAEKYR